MDMEKEKHDDHGHGKKTNMTIMDMEKRQT